MSKATAIPSDSERFAKFRWLMNNDGLNAVQAARVVGIDPSTGWGWAAYAGITKPKNTRRWTEREETLLLKAGRGQLAIVASGMGRTYFAAYRHRERLLKCSDAKPKGRRMVRPCP